MTKEEAMEKGHDLDVYLDSEMSDEETHDFDDLWQSIYDIVQLGINGIVESDPREEKAAVAWLKETQALTKNYKHKEILFEVE